MSELLIRHMLRLAEASTTEKVDGTREIMELEFGEKEGWTPGKIRRI